jgi:hypothetical protein
MYVELWNYSYKFKHLLLMRDWSMKQGTKPKLKICHLHLRSSRHILWTSIGPSPIHLTPLPNESLHGHGIDLWPLYSSTLQRWESWDRSLVFDMIQLQARAAPSFADDSIDTIISSVCSMDSDDSFKHWYCCLTQVCKFIFYNQNRTFPHWYVSILT